MGAAPVQTHIERTTMTTTTDRQTDKRVSTYNHLPAGMGAGWGKGTSHGEWPWEDTEAMTPQSGPCPEDQS